MNATRRRMERELVAAAPESRRASSARAGARSWARMLAGAPLPAGRYAARWFERFFGADVAARIDAQLPDALEAMARSLRSGSSLPMAIGEAAVSAPQDLAGGLREIANAAARGRPLRAAIDRWSETTPGRGVGLAAAALGLGAELGGSAARSLDAVAGTLRDRIAARREVRALSAQARMSALVIGIAPLVFLLVVASADPSAIGFLFGSPVGWACLASGVGLDALGAWWMQRIVAGAAIERDPVAAQQADVIDLFALALGAGLNLRLSVIAVAGRAPPAWAPALANVVEQLDRGRRVADALDALPDVLGEPARPLARVLAGAERYGTPLLPALDRLALDARLDRRRRAEEAARRVPVKLLFPLVLCVLPAFGLLTVAPLLAGALDALRL
jgi:Flp pilus assembly protein TadB